MSHMDRPGCAAFLRDLADRVEKGQVDQLFTVVVVENEDGFLCASDVQGATNLGAAYAIESLAERIECCTDFLPGSIKTAVQAIMADFNEPDVIEAGQVETTKH